MPPRSPCSTGDSCTRHLRTTSFFPPRVVVSSPLFFFFHRELLFLRYHTVPRNVLTVARARSKGENEMLPAAAVRGGPHEIVTSPIRAGHELRATARASGSARARALRTCNFASAFSPRPRHININNPLGQWRIVRTAPSPHSKSRCNDRVSIPLFVSLNRAQVCITRIFAAGSRCVSCVTQFFRRIIDIRGAPRPAGRPAARDRHRMRDDVRLHV